MAPAWSPGNSQACSAAPSQPVACCLGLPQCGAAAPFLGYRKAMYNLHRHPQDNSLQAVQHAFPSPESAIIRIPTIYRRLGWGQRSLCPKLWGARNTHILTLVLESREESISSFCSCVNSGVGGGVAKLRIMGEGGGARRRREGGWWGGCQIRQGWGGEGKSRRPKAGFAGSLALHIWRTCLHRSRRHASKEKCERTKRKVTREGR